tara:strand:- start:32 stop:265 length:234 start_codon:yes stop_codon:yes gene_type:complete
MENDQRNFVYLIMKQDKQSNYISSQHVSEKKYGGYFIYGIYASNHAAIETLHGIYEEQILGVKHDAEYMIIKKEVYN